MNNTNIILEFKERATFVSAVIHDADTVEDAFRITISLCQGNRVLVAPELEIAMYQHLDRLCKENNVTLIKNDLRKYSSKIEVGLTFADFGIAETGTIVLNSDSEDKRLSTMISQTHVAMLYKSKIRTTALDMAEELASLTSKPSSYTAFITGPSRTADIERVLAIGVHGPLELHIILLEDTAHNFPEIAQKSHQIVEEQ